MTIAAVPRENYTDVGVIDAEDGPRRVRLDDVRHVFRRWLGDNYDLDALNIILAAAAAEQLMGDPAWVMLVSGSGWAKTETVQALAGAGAIVTSTITSEGALLSGSAKKEKATDATGGLLRRTGSRGVVVIKDATSILSMNRDSRGAVLAALREIYDGRWERNIGMDGGRTLTWTGRIVVIAACTTAWDRAHDVMAAMGDRFVVVRMDSTRGRLAAGRQAIQNTGHEVEMREALARAVGRLIKGISPVGVELTEREKEQVLAVADIVTRARTGVDFDYRGNVTDAHLPEAPTRFAKQLAQVVRGAVAIGVERDAALKLAIRCARDSMPPIRLEVLDDVAANLGTLTRDVRRRLQKPRATVDRALQCLHQLGVLVCDEEDTEHMGKPVTLWRYSLAPEINPTVLGKDPVPDLSPPMHEGTQVSSRHTPTDISGTEKEGAVDAGAEHSPAASGRLAAPFRMDNRPT